MISYRSEVITDDSNGKWISPGHTFATIEEAEAHAHYLRVMRKQVRQIRITAVGEPVNHRWEKGVAIQIAQMP